VVEKDAHVGPLDRVVEVRVVKDDGGGFAAEFQRDLFEVGLACGLEEETAGTGGAGEGDLVDVGVLDESGACEFGRLISSSWGWGPTSRLTHR
jgi:hypothetical protein